MRKNFSAARLTCLLAFAVLLIASVVAFAQEPKPSQPWSQNTSPLPPATGSVNDYAGVIDAATKQQLEAKLKSFKETTNPSVEIAVAVVKTTGDRDIFDYSLAVARGWKIGSKLDDNPSALLFVAITDRKYYTQVSKDLEDELPDGVVGSLQRQYLVPEFKNGNYGKGISDTIDAYISTIRNKGNAPVNSSTNRPPPVPRSGGSGSSLSTLFCCGVVILIILLIIFSRRGGGSGGGLAGNIASGVIGGLIGQALSGGSSGGGSDWGGGSSGGGSDWGGFGGGGDFGGGGAGGDW